MEEDYWEASGKYTAKILTREAPFPTPPTPPPLPPEMPNNV